MTALYEVKSHEGASGVAATVFLRHEDAETGSVTETSSEFHLDEMSATFEQAAPRFQLAAAFAEFAEVLQNSYGALDGNLTDARMLAQRVSDLLPEDADVTQFAGLVAGAEGIGQ